MRNELCERLGIEAPIFAFTHCRDVVVAVSQAGGLGVLGAVGFTADQLRQELDWIDAHIGDKPYAVDIVIPQKYEGMDETDPDKLRERLESMIPAEHRNFAEDLLSSHGVPAAIVASPLPSCLSRVRRETHSRGRSGSPHDFNRSSPA